MPILDTSSSITSTGNTTTVWPHTVTATGVNRLLMVSLSNRNGCTANPLSNVSYNGVNLTKLSAVLQPGGSYYNEVWYLVNPSTGTNNVSVTSLNGGCEYLNAIATSWTGVSQTNPLGTVTALTGSNSAGTQSVTLAGTQTSDTIFSSLTLTNGATSTFSSGTTNIKSSLLSGYTIYANQTVAAATNTIYTFSQNTYTDWEIVSVALHSDTGSTPAPATYAISGKVFNDANSNGILDPGETAYVGAVVNLTGAASASTTSDSFGNYTFSNLSTGTYTLTLTIPTGYKATTVNPVSVTLSANTTDNFGLVSTPVTSTSVSGAPVTMPIISWGVPTSASSVSGTNLVSNINTAPGTETTNLAYDSLNNHNWQSTSVPAWVALDLSSVPTSQRGKVDVLWYNNTNAFDCCLIASGGTYAGLPRNYTIEANSAVGGVTPSSGWITLATVTGNTYHERENVVDLTGYNWVRVNVSTVNGTDTSVQLMHLDIFDLSASKGVPQDSWAFYGDSITLGSTNYAKVYVGSPLNFTYSTLINNQLSKYYPAQTDGGIVGASITDAQTNLSNWLSVFPGKYVDISYGTNDATANMAPATFYSKYSGVIQTVLAAGKIPIVPKIPWAAATTTEVNVPGLNTQIDSLYAAFPSIIKGPDFHTYFLNNPTLIQSGGIHPTENGYAAMKRLWACSMLVSVYGVPESTVATSSGCSSFAAYLPNSTSTPAPATYAISGKVFNDANSNGILDPGETGYSSGAVLTLSGAASGTTTSASDGTYSFPNLPGGNYSVALTVPSNYKTTSLNPVSISLAANNTTNFGIIQLTATPPPSTSSSPLLDASSVISSTSQSQTSWSHIVSSGSNRLLVVSISNRNGCTTSPITSVTSNGVALTKLAAVLQSPSNSYYNEIWYLLNPVSGTNTINISAANGGCEYLSAVATSWTGVNQTTPFGTPVILNNDGSGAQTVTLSNTQTTDTILSTINQDNGATASFGSPSALVNTSINTGSNTKNYVVQTPVSSTSTSLQVNLNSYSNWVIFAVAMHGI
ncbi:MAG: hypothetical protein NVSMB66_5120 [Candidatus Doudnabacteria bacterium]